MTSDLSRFDPAAKFRDETALLDELVAQAALSARVDSVHVIGDEHKQSRPPHFHRNGG